MAGPDFLSTHRRQRRYRKPARSQGRVGSVRFVAPIMVLGFIGTLAALQLPLTSSDPVGANGVPVRVVSAAAGDAESGGSDYAASRDGARAGASQGDTSAARFGFCHSGGGSDCVVDGDTFWFAGEKYRIADIDTP